MDMDQTTVAQGNAFRDRVAALLRAAQVQNVRTEVRVGHKKVDILFDEVGFTQRRRIAVECKDYEKPLTKNQIRDEIFADYKPLLDSNDIDGLLIVGRVPINADANTYVEGIRGFQYKTFIELQNTVMDFAGYLQAMITQFREQGLDKYYVRPRLNDHQDLEDRIKTWLSTAGSQPIAILAGYGMGKTSFARRAASIAASEHMRTGNARIPILIRLGEIANEQGLEGLLGKVFTATNVVRNYHFDLFMELNRAGRLFIILDGFDEMKHTMSWSHFKYNFGELNRLVVPDSKVMLLGRPSAFLSETEHDLVLRGIARFGAKAIREPGWHEYEELSMSEFGRETAYGFIEAYILYLRNVNQATGRRMADDTTLAQRVAEVRNIGYEFLIGRPVQARMLAEIAADVDVELRSFSRFELYQIFITRLIERELQKAVRQRIDSNERREFIRAVAWWLWSTRASSGFCPDKLPRSLVARFDPDDEHDIEALKRELLSGSMLEKKAGDMFYFPHRSFQEFLVAEYILSRHWSTGDIHEVSGALTQDVARFLQEADRLDVIVGWSELLAQPKGALSVEFLRLIAVAMKSAGRPLDVAPSAKNPLLVIVQTLSRHSDTGDATVAAYEYAVRVMAGEHSLVTKLAGCLAAFVSASMMRELHAEYFERICAHILADSLESIEEVLDRGVRYRPASNVLSDFAQIVLVAFRRAPSAADGRIELLIDLDAAVKEVQNLLRPTVMCEWAGLEELQMGVEVLGEYVPRLKMSQKGATVARFFKQYPDPGKAVVPVYTRERRPNSRQQH